MSGLPAPTLTAPVVGNPISQSYLQSQVYNPLSFLLNPPLFHGYQATAQSIANNAFTSVNIDTTVIDTHGGHSNTTNPTRYTFQVPGWYRLEGMTVFASNSTGFRGAKFLKNGTTQVINSENVKGAISAFQTTTMSSAWVQAVIGDYVELQAYQNSGASLSTSSAGSFEYVTCMRIQWISN